MKRLFGLILLSVLIFGALGLPGAPGGKGGGGKGAVAPLIPPPAPVQGPIPATFPVSRQVTAQPADYKDAAEKLAQYIRCKLGLPGAPGGKGGGKGGVKGGKGKGGKGKGGKGGGGKGGGGKGGKGGKGAASPFYQNGRLERYDPLRQISTPRVGPDFNPAEYCVHQGMPMGVTTRHGNLRRQNQYANAFNGDIHFYEGYVPFELAYRGTGPRGKGHGQPANPNNFWPLEGTIFGPTRVILEYNTRTNTFGPHWWKTDDHYKTCQQENFAALADRNADARAAGANECPNPIGFYPW